MGFNDINLQVSGPQQPASIYKTKVLKGQVPFATQVTEPNTKYVIKHNFVLDGDVTIPENCILEFDGGSISGEHTITLDNTPIISSTKCFGENITLAGSLYNNDFYFDWFNTYKIDKHDFTTVAVTEDTRNDVIMAHHMYKQYNYHFGDGVYPFNKPIGQEDENWTEAFFGGNYFGLYRHKTFLYFPNSKGFSLYGGDWGNNVLKDFTIYSKYECFFVYVYASDDAGVSNSRYNAVHESVFENLELYTTDGDFCFGAYIPYMSFIYGNHFKHVWGWCKEDGVIFSGIGSIGTEYYDCCDARYLGGYRENIKVMPICKASLWDACIGVTARDCNTGYGLKHIYTYKNAGKNASELGLHNSLGVIGNMGVCLEFHNCNFESYVGTFIETKNSNVGFNSICFDDNCTFVLDISSTEINDDKFSAFIIYRFESIKLPNNITHIPNYGGDVVSENKLVRTKNGFDVRYNNVKIMVCENDIDTPTSYFYLPQNTVNEDFSLPYNSYEFYKAYEGAAYKKLYIRNNFLQGIEITDKTIRVCKPITWSSLYSLLGGNGFGNRIIIVEADITCDIEHCQTGDLKGLIFKGGKLLNGMEAPATPHIGLSGDVFISAEKVQIADSTIDIYGAWRAKEVFKEWWGTIDESTFNSKIGRMSPIGAMYFNGIKPLWLKEVVSDVPIWVDATGATV